MVVRLLATFRSGFDWTARFEASVEAVLAGSLGGCIRLLLRGVTQLSGGKGCSSAAFTLEDNDKPPEDTFYKMFSRC